jgi:hypothetical protein
MLYHLVQVRSDFQRRLSKNLIEKTLQGLHWTQT